MLLSESCSALKEAQDRVLFVQQSEGVRMKGEEQQAERRMDGKADCGKEGGTEQQGRPRRRQGAVFVGRKTLWKESRAPNFGSLNCKRLDQKC